MQNNRIDQTLYILRADSCKIPLENKVQKLVRSKRKKSKNLEKSAQRNIYSPKLSFAQKSNFLLSLTRDTDRGDCITLSMQCNLFIWQILKSPLV